MSPKPKRVRGQTKFFGHAAVKVDLRLFDVHMVVEDEVTLIDGHKLKAFPQTFSRKIDLRLGCRVGHSLEGDLFRKPVQMFQVDTTRDRNEVPQRIADVSLFEFRRLECYAIDCFGEAVLGISTAFFQKDSEQAILDFPELPLAFISCWPQPFEECVVWVGRDFICHRTLSPREETEQQNQNNNFVEGRITPRQK
jgi:hypothetical protein